MNDTGTGNTLNLSHPRVIQMVADSLRYWVSEMRVDGFRFDLGTILAREPDGFKTESGFLKAIGQDPLLAEVKLIAEPWERQQQRLIRWTGTNSKARWRASIVYSRAAKASHTVGARRGGARHARGSDLDCRITRSVALETLERHGLTWRIACTSSSLSGVRAAALAGLGVAVHARGLIPDGLVELNASTRLPELAEVEFVVTGARTGQRGPAAVLAKAILANGDRLQRAA